MEAVKVQECDATMIHQGTNAGDTQIPEVAIVILNWNGKRFLEQFLPSVLLTTYFNKRIIVADNASTDDSVSYLKTNFPSVEVLVNATNEGFAKGYNTALKQIRSDYYVLLNSDVEVTPGWVEPIIELMERDKTIGACQPKLLSVEDKHQLEYAGAAGGWMDWLGYPFTRGRIFESIEYDTGQYDDVGPCFWATGAALFFKARLYHEAGGLDEYFFAHQEEIDLCWRIQLAGYKVYVHPQSVVYHLGGGTLPKGNSRKVFLNFRNNLIMLAKNYTLGVSLYKIPIRLMLDGVAAWRELFIGNAGGFAAIVKSHVHFVKWLLFDQKKSVFPASKKGKPAGLYAGSVVWQHFIKKKKTFSEIIHNK